MSETIERSSGPPGDPWEYAAAPESPDIVTIEDSYGLFIGGEFVEPKSGRRYTTIDPATEEPLAEVAEAGPEDVDAGGGGGARGGRPAGERSRRLSARSTSSGSRDACRSGRGSSRCSSL